MSAEVIRSIRQAEEQAEDIIQEAMLKAKDIIAQAEEQGGDIIETETQNAREEGIQVVERQKAKATKEIGKLNQESDAKCEKMTLQARAKKDAASSYIMERIVKSYGDN